MTASKSVSALLSDFYRCPHLATEFSIRAPMSPVSGYFRVENELICYGCLSEAEAASTADAFLPEVHAHVSQAAKKVTLPFDPAGVATNLQLEKYVTNGGKNGGSLVRWLYYLLRPLMPVHLRKHLHRLSLRGWDRISFPHWPVDRTVDRLHEWLLALAMKAEGITELPFVWFWPEGFSGCASITHDVETGAGRDFCWRLMDLNDSYGIKASFQVVPEGRYELPPAFLDSIRQRGFEVNIHDLNHDGHLFNTCEQFLERVKRINHYGKQFAARGFRSAVLYRRLDWINELEFAYDMSVPNVAHLDPQRGGCCTVMPYFIGDIIEIPVTVTQDYTLFHVLGNYSTKLWEQQIKMIIEAHGMATFIIHPDYVLEQRARQTYEQLLKHLAALRESQKLWIAQPGEISDWWRARAQMQLVRDGDKWRIEGRGSELARVAYARAEEGGIVYRVEQNRSREPILS